MTQISAREIRGLLQQNVNGLVAKLFPNERVTSPTFTPRNPTRQDNNPGSFVVWMTGPAAGGFNEYSPKGPPASGDVVDLIAYVHNRPGDKTFAFAWARDFLGLKAMSDQEKRAAKARARNHVAINNASQSEAMQQRQAAALKLWNKREPLLGSLAETYLAARRIPYRLIANTTLDLCFIPKLEHWQSAVWDKTVTPWRKISEGYIGPVMIAAGRNRSGEVTAVHCTFLTADGTAKAPLGKQAKLMRGNMRGSAIFLTRGKDNLSVTEARQHGVLHPFMPFEGIENALSYALEVPDPRIAACGSFDLMMAYPVEDEDVFDPVIYGLDNDDNAKAADAIADRIAAVKASGKDCSFVRPPEGVKDFNDLIRGE